jgi:hypothetical protein
MEQRGFEPPAATLRTCCLQVLELLPHTRRQDELYHWLIVSLSARSALSPPLSGSSASRQKQSGFELPTLRSRVGVKSSNPLCSTIESLDWRLAESPLSHYAFELMLSDLADQHR